MIRRSGCSRDGRRCRRRRCRSLSARLVGYRWPEQAESDDLDAFADADGIVCLPSVAGEPPAADRLQQVLAAAFGESWSPAKVKELLEQAGSKKKNLADWLRDEFFKQHCALFGNRPFVWHIWDGQRDGFSALVNYHRLDRKMLEKLTYTYLGQDWVERQRAEVRDERRRRRGSAVGRVGSAAEARGDPRRGGTATTSTSGGRSCTSSRSGGSPT